MTTAQTRRWRRRARLHVCPFCRIGWMEGSRRWWVWACAGIVALAMLNGLLDTTVWLLDLAVAWKQR